MARHSSMPFARVAGPKSRSCTANIRRYPPSRFCIPRNGSRARSPAGISWPAFDSGSAVCRLEAARSERARRTRRGRSCFANRNCARKLKSAAAGWNGDRYAVFVDEKANAFLMLMYTTWDTPADAEEFAAAYRPIARRPNIGMRRCPAVWSCTATKCSSWKAPPRHRWTRSWNSIAAPHCCALSAATPRDRAPGCYDSRPKKRPPRRNSAS